MGIKGKIAFALKMPKVARPLLQSIYRELMNIIILTSENDDEINEKIMDVGKNLAETLFMDYADRISKHADTFTELSETLGLAYKVNTGQEFTDISVIEDSKEIRFVDDNCILCEGVDVRGNNIMYCNIVAGVFDAVLNLKDINGISYQETCKASGDHTCTWVVKGR